MLCPVFVRNPADLIEFGQKFNQVAPISLFYDTTASNPEEVTRKIREFYFGDQPIDMSVFRNFTNVGSPFLTFNQKLTTFRFKF